VFGTFDLLGLRFAAFCFLRKLRSFYRADLALTLKLLADPADSYSGVYTENRVKPTASAS
jgi:hypothetical protein